MNAPYETDTVVREGAVGQGSAAPGRCPVAHGFDALGDDYFRDPALAFKAVRDEAPIFWYPYLNSWVVTRKADVEEVLSDWQVFHNGHKGESIEVPAQFHDVFPQELIASILIGSDPPRHTLARSVAQRGFTKDRMDALQPEIEARAHRIIDRIEHLGESNLMQSYCLELTTQTFMALTRLPAEDEDMMRQLRDDLFMILGSALEPMKEPQRSEVWGRYVAAQLHLRDIVRERRAEPGTDLISVMASACAADGTPLLSIEQIAVHIGEFAGAATDTTAQAMANAVLFLDANPEALAQAKADPRLWAQVFDETVRRRPSGTSTRWARQDVRLGDVEIRKGDAVWLALSSANTDETYYDHPFDFDIHREPLGDHLAFTKGRHTCLGQPLARVQGTTGLKVLYERLPSLRPAADIPLDFVPLALLPIRRTLPVLWDTTDARAAVAEAPSAAAPQAQLRPDSATGPGGAAAPADQERTPLDLVVVARREESEGVISLELEAPDGAELPAWSPGAHVDVEIGDIVGDGIGRQYSLCSDPADRRRWRLGVLREADSRGGSTHLHDTLRVGDHLPISRPRNNFPFLEAKHYLFIAGGIGITPLLPMIRAAHSRGADWHLLYGGRNRASMAYLDELARYGHRVVVAPQDEAGLLDLASVLGRPQDDVLVYACGPEPLLQAIEGSMVEWPESALHLERFRPVEHQGTGPDEAFTVEFADSGHTAEVPADRTILQVAEEFGINVFSSCREGTCGTCETPILEGRADHRDSLLSPRERAAQDAMMICVSRAEAGCPSLRLAL
ncbi:Cytochrome P450 [Raineyella antarctica]|uniref:Cytochrome P450 n=1 Tax=Raineyella antarctica TaxID=1577474 RepID=A0A1G6HQ03_9ACTN|nr:cytochrome P450 [Raineyella antarctica]SDB96274.1 Cytochrome P450 [Raineyella antarctica]